MFISADDNKIEPSVIDAPLGETVTFKCKSYGKASWMEYDSATNLLTSLPRNSLLLGNDLHIIDVEEENKGHYECWGNTEELNIWSKHSVAFAAKSTLTIKKG